MNKILTFLSFLLFLSYNCKQDLFISNTTKNIVETTNIDKGITINHQYYDLHIYAETLRNKPNLVAAITLHKDAYFLSPNDKHNFTGKFFMDLGNDKDLSFKGGIIEIPLAKIDNGPYPIKEFNKGVKVVYANTTYKQPLDIKAKGNFEVSGRIQFTIEPSCTFEEIPFTISYHDGKLQVKPPTKC